MSERRDEAELEEGRPLRPASEEPRAAEAAEPSVALTSLRPRTAPELADEALDLFRERFLACVGPAVLAWLPIVLYLRLAGGPFGAGPVEEPVEIVGALLLGLGLPVLLQAAVASIVTLIAHGEWIGRRVRLGAALREVGRRLVGLGLLLLLTGTAYLAGIVITAVPAMACPGFVLLSGVVLVFLAWRLSVAPQAWVLERASPAAALARSFRLTQRTFLRWLALTVLQVALTSWFLGLDAVLDDPTVAGEVAAWLGMSTRTLSLAMVPFVVVFQALVTALQAAIATSYYLDCRIRNEGFDLELRLERLEALAAEGALP